MSAVNKTPIRCPHCGEFVAYEENIENMALPTGGLKCPNCKKIVVEPREPRYLY